MRIGAHESVAGGLDGALVLAAEDGCDAVQIFTKAAGQWREPVFAEEAVAAFRERRAAWPGRGKVMAHGSYLVNLCADTDLLLERSRESLYLELCRCEAFGIDYVVFHAGAHLGLGEELGLDRIGESLAGILERTRGFQARLCIENMAGQGTTLGHTLEQIGAMIDRAGPEGRRLGVCIDTQHAFAAGHDLGPADRYDAFWDAFDRFIGLDRLSCLHLNDSRCGLGQNVDRHERIGEGEMGLLPFWRLVNDPRFADLPAVVELPPLEAPKGRYEQDLAALRGLAGAAEPAAGKPFVLTPLEPRMPRSKRAARR